MTLLLATQSPSKIIISADGMSLVTHKRPNSHYKTPGRITLQKVFPLDSRPIAVAHFGTNKVKVDSGSRSIKSVIHSWMKSDIADDVSQIADQLRSAIVAVRPDLDCGFWVAGFDRDKEAPQFYQFKVAVNESLTQIEDCAFKEGDGKHFVQKPWSDHLATYHGAIVAQARKGGQCFGGHRHQLSIGRTGSRWDVEPKYGTLG
ncbi:unnamed protein product, partial [marine sediment metagenome]